MGVPITLRCAKCKGVDNGRGYKLEATGRTRPLRPSERGNIMRGMMALAAEYRCLECAHVGWSRHGTMARLLARGGFPPLVYEPGWGYRLPSEV